MKDHAVQTRVMGGIFAGCFGVFVRYSGFAMFFSTEEVSLRIVRVRV
jgi:hypothetical protein